MGFVGRIKNRFYSNLLSENLILSAGCVAFERFNNRTKRREAYR